MERGPLKQKLRRAKRSTSSRRRASFKETTKSSRKKLLRVGSISAKSNPKSNVTDSFFDETEESTRTSSRRFQHSKNDELLVAIENFLNLKDLELSANGSRKSGKTAPKGQFRARHVSPEGTRSNTSGRGFEGLFETEIQRCAPGEVSEKEAIQKIHQKTEFEGGSDVVPQ